MGNIYVEHVGLLMTNMMNIGGVTHATVIAASRSPTKT